MDGAQAWEPSGGSNPLKKGDRVAWHEMKTGVIFRLEDRARTHSQRPVILGKTYVAWRGDPGEFGRRLHSEAIRQGLHQARQVYVVAAGALWIWNIVQDRLIGAVEVLDFYHAAQHLWAVADELYGEDREAARRWVSPLLHKLKHGDQEDRESWLDQPFLARIWAKSFPGKGLRMAAKRFSPEPREEAKLTRISFSRFRP